MTNSNNNGAQRRRFPRRNFPFSIGVLAHGDYSILPAAEIGEGGMSFTSHQAIEVGEHVVVNFFIPQKGFISISSRVSNRRNPAAGSTIPNFGVQFVNLAFEFKRMIRDYIADKTSEEDNKDQLALSATQTVDEF